MSDIHMGQLLEGRVTSRFESAMSRRDALKTLGVVSATGALGLTLGDFAFAAPLFQRRPNVVFILSDDHRWDYLSCLGHPFLETRNMDRIAREGVHFTNAFVTTSLCSPSRASFLTGQYAHTHGVKNNLTVWRDENITFLELFKQAGYDTSFIGKWHMPGRLPTLRGVDQFITFTVQGGQGRYFNCPLIIDGVETPSRKPYITEELTDLAIEFIEKERENPFCLYLSHKAVHHQFLPPPELSHIYDDVELTVPDEADPWITMTNGNTFAGTLGPLKHHLRNYCEALVALDLQIGRVLDKLDELGIADNTIVVYAGDNGYFWGEHRLIDKRWSYEEAIRIPFMVRYPKLVKKPGRRAEQMILNIDLAPSLLEMAGLPIPDMMEGQSIKPFLVKESSPGRDAWLYEYFKEFPYNVPEHNAVRTRTHIYIEYEGPRPPELFDLVHDPRQLRNIAGTPEGEPLVAQLSQTLRELMSEAQ